MLNNIKINFDKDYAIKRMYKIVALLTIIFIFAAILFTNYILKVEKKTAEDFLEQSVIQTASNIRGRSKNDITNLQILSAKLSAFTDTFSSKDIDEFLLENITNKEYFILSFMHPDGKTVRYKESKGKLDVKDWKNFPCYIETIENGLPCFSTVRREPEAKSGYVNRYFVPVFNDDEKIVGALGSQIDSDIFNRILQNNNYNNQAYSSIIDAEGNYILKSENIKSEKSNFFDNDIVFLKKNIEEIKSDLKTKNSGTFWFKNKNGKIYIASYSQIENNTLVLTDVPQSVLLHHVNNLLIGISIIVLVIGICLLFLLKYSNKLNRQNEKALFKIAFIDEVTGSGNKAKFILDTKNILGKNQDSKYAMLSVDIYKFKAINELLGYKTADVILKDVLGIIKHTLPKGSICARDFAATFVVLCKYEKEEDVINIFKAKLTEEINKYNETTMVNFYSEFDAQVSTKINLIYGIYYIVDKDINVTQMCDRASYAKRQVKNKAFINYKIYDDGLRAQLLQEKSIDDDMQNALKNEEFKLYLQPKFDLKTLEIAGAESLVRWVHPIKGVIPPNDFIPVFEKNGFIVELDKYMWEKTCRFLKYLKDNNMPLFPISVNVSKINILNNSFIKEIVEITDSYGIEHKYLEAELTESACLTNEETFINFVNQLKENGFAISMDDFGTGYSSLNMLRKIPVDVLKLDRGFITDTMNDEKGLIVIQTILDMAEKLKMKTVAEGIETPEQADFLRESGCKIAQGFLYGRPTPSEQFEKSFLKNNNSVDAV